MTRGGEYRRARVASGLCERCPKIREGRYATYCNAHGKEHAEYARKWNRKAREAGKCPQCGARIKGPYSGQCVPCAVAARKRQRAALCLKPWRPGGYGRIPFVKD